MIHNPTSLPLSSLFFLPPSCLYFLSSLSLFCCSIEEDFVTWKEGLWPEVMQYFKIDSSQATAVGREYEFSLHTEISTDEVFTGEPNRLGSYKNQKV